MVGISLQTMAGLLGAAVMVGAYLALQLGRLQGQGYYYAGLNAVGAALVLASLFEQFNLSSAIIQAIWLSVSIIGITRYYVLSRMSRVTPEERAFLETSLPGLRRIDARRLLDLGVWGDGEPGMQLTEQDQPNRNIYYLVSGEAAVRADGIPIATLSGDTFVGDMSLISGGQATATVELARPSRYVAFPVDGLRRLLDRNEEVHRHMKAALSGQVVSKLLRTSRDLAQSRRGVAGGTESDAQDRDS